MKQISLFDMKDHGTSSTLDSFLILDTKDSKAQTIENLFRFSPKIMKWNETHLWVIDLSPCLDYWNQQAHQQKVDTFKLLEQKVRQLFPQSLSIFAPHPWTGILFWQHLNLKNQKDVFHWSRPFCQKLYQNITWWTM